jgi:hypothetical protein
VWLVNRLLMSNLPLSFIISQPRQINSIFTINRPILYISFTTIYKLLVGKFCWWHECCLLLLLIDICYQGVIHFRLKISISELIKVSLFRLKISISKLIKVSPFRLKISISELIKVSPLFSV